MPEIKTDEQMRSEYMPRIRSFTDKRLTAENAKRIYDKLKPYHYDTSGWLLYEAAKGILQADVYSEFPAEDNMGYFEMLDGYGLLKWLEIAKFAEKEYEQIRGGYEKLTSHTIDEKSPAYQEFQGKLYAAAIRSIAIQLCDKQPYLLEGFWNRLCNAEDSIKNGQLTKDDLIDKIDRAFSAFEHSTPIAKRDEMFMSEFSLKTAFRNALYTSQLSDYAIKALYQADDILHDMYNFLAENSKNLPDSTYDVCYEYVEKAEHEYLANSVYDRAATEYYDYVEEVKKLPPDKIIEDAYKLAMLYDIGCALDPPFSNLTTEQLKALMSTDDLIWSLFQKWQKRDNSIMDDITMMVDEVADERAKENRENDYEIDPVPFGQRDLLNEDEDEMEV